MNNGVYTRVFTRYAYSFIDNLENRLVGMKCQKN